MCYILIGKQIGPKSNTVETQIRKLLKDKMDINDDGYYFRNGRDIIRTLDDKVAKKAVEESTINNLLVHFRMASAGVVSEKNVHGWTKGAWSFMHNGGISTYVDWTKGAKLQEETDSLLLFQDLMVALEGNSRNYKDKVVCATIQDVLSHVVFWGRAALYNSETDKLYLFGDFHIYAFGTMYIIISSTSVNFDEKVKRDFHGLEAEFKNPSLIGESKIDGIGVINRFSTPQFKYRKLADKLETKSRTQYGADRETRILDADDWAYSQGTYRRRTVHAVTGQTTNEDKKIITPGLPTIILPSATPNIQEMMDNIENARDEEVLDQNLNGSYSEEELEELFFDENFVGWLDDGTEMYRDMYGIHVKYFECCNQSKCRGFDDMKDIILKEEFMTEEMKLEYKKEKIGFRV